MAFLIAQLKKEGVIIRNLHVSQILGGIDVICFDKTGTLTKNNVMLSHLFLDQFQYQLKANEPSGLSGNWPVFRALAESILATNTAKLCNPDKDNRSKSSEQQQESQILALENAYWSGNRMDIALVEYLECIFGVGRELG